MRPSTIRQTKRRVLELLSEGPAGLQELTGLGPPRLVINPLFGLLYHGSPEIKWRAVEAMGLVTAHLATTDPESARVIMRRLMWNLNDESGGIGWGSPEAMGEITARSRLLADEFGCLLVSYINPRGNYLEHPLLQRGALWGLGRLVNRRPGHAGDSAEHLAVFLDAPDPHLRALAAWAAGPLKSPLLKRLLRDLLDDNRQVTLFMNGKLRSFEVGSLAAAALQKY